MWRLNGIEQDLSFCHSRTLAWIPNVRTSLWLRIFFCHPIWVVTSHRSCNGPGFGTRHSLPFSSRARVVVVVSRSAWAGNFEESLDAFPSILGCSFGSWSCSVSRGPVMSGVEIMSSLTSFRRFAVLNLCNFTSTTKFLTGSLDCIVWDLARGSSIAQLQRLVLKVSQRRISISDCYLWDARSSNRSMMPS